MKRFSKTHSAGVGSIVQGMLPEILKGNVVQGLLMSCSQHDRRRHTCLVSLFPSGHTKTPPVARFETGESQVWCRRSKVIAPAPGEGEECVRDFRAHDMRAEVILIRLTFPLPLKSCNRVQ
jgi:hypothetical protein